MTLTIIITIDTNVLEHQKRNQESKSTAIAKVKNNKHTRAEGERHTVRNKLNEDLQIMCHKLRHLQMPEREKLPKLKSKLIKLQEEINGVDEERLEEEEMDITDINNLIYAAAKIMTQTLNELRKEVLENKSAETDK